MSVTQIDLDDEALAEVMRIAGVHTKKEASDALRRVAGINQVGLFIADGGRYTAARTERGTEYLSRRPDDFQLTLWKPRRDWLNTPSP